MQRYQWRVIVQLVVFLVLISFLPQLLGLVLGLVPALGVWLETITGGAILPLFVFAGSAFYLNAQMGLDLDHIGLPTKQSRTWVLHLLVGLVLGAVGLAFVWVIHPGTAVVPISLTLTSLLGLLFRLVLAVVSAAATELIMRGTIARTLLANLEPGLALGWAVLFETVTVILAAFGLTGTAPVERAGLGAVLAALAFSFFQVALYWRTWSLWVPIGTRAGLQFMILLLWGRQGHGPAFTIFGALPAEATSLLLQEGRAATLMALLWLALACILFFFPGFKRGSRTGRNQRQLH